MRGDDDLQAPVAVQIRRREAVVVRVVGEPVSDSIPLGPFDLHDPIGKGGMGVVWRGVHRRSGVPVAVKALRGDRAWDDRLLELFASEVRAVAGLTHPGVVVVLDHGAIPAATQAASGGLIPAGSPSCPLWQLMQPRSSSAKQAEAVIPWYS